MSRGTRTRELVEEEVRQSPVLHELLEQARASGQSLITYHGVTAFSHCERERLVQAVPALL